MVLFSICCCFTRAVHELEMDDARSQLAQQQAARRVVALRAVKAASVSAVELAQVVVRDIDNIPSLPTRLTSLTAAEGKIRAHITALLRPETRGLFENSDSWKEDVSSVQQALRSVLAAKEKVTTMIDAACGQQSSAMLAASGRSAVSGYQRAHASTIRDALSPSAAVDIHLMSADILAETKMSSSNPVSSVIKQKEAPLHQLRDELKEIPRCGAITKYDQLFRKAAKVMKGARALARLPLESFSGGEPTHQLNHRLLELYKELLQETIEAQERRRSLFPSEEQFRKDKANVALVMKEVATKLNALRAGVEGAQIPPESEGHEDVQAPLLRNGDSGAAFELE